MKTIFRRTLMSIMVFTTIVISSWAASTQSTIILKNGSKIIGDIIVQRPGVDLTIDGVRAELVIEESNFRSVQNKKVKYEKLSREWKRWALENKALKGDAYGRYLEMFDIVTKSNKYTNLVKVTREESPKVFYLQIEKSTYKFDWDIINEIQKKLPSKDEVTGIEDEVITITGKKYRGTIVSQKIGNNIIIKTEEKRVELNMYEVLETKTVARSSSFSLSEQAGYSNTLVMKDGTFKDGIVVSKHYGQKNNDKYIMLLNNKGKKEKILMSKVVEYRTSFFKKDESVYKNGAVYVNEFRINKAAVKNEKGFTCYVEKKIYPFPEGIAITFKTQGASLQGPWNMIALEKVEMQDGASTYGYDSNIKKNNSITPSTTDLSDGMSSISFAYLSPGYYALVNENSNASYIIKIVK